MIYPAVDRVYDVYLHSSGEWFRVEEIGKGGASGPNWRLSGPIEGNLGPPEKKSDPVTSRVLTPVTRFPSMIDWLVSQLRGFQLAQLVRTANKS